MIDDPRYRSRRPAPVCGPVLLTSGKLYYELDAYRQARTTSPTPRSSGSSSSTRCRAASSPPSWTRYPNATDVRWVQEEPANQGAWPFLALALPEMLPTAARASSGCRGGAMAAPSAGSRKVHEVEQANIIDRAFQ